MLTLPWCVYSDKNLQLYYRYVVSTSYAAVSMFDETLIFELLAMYNAASTTTTLYM